MVVDQADIWVYIASYIYDFNSLSSYFCLHTFDCSATKFEFGRRRVGGGELEEGSWRRGVGRGGGEMSCVQKWENWVWAWELSCHLIRFSIAHSTIAQRVDTGTLLVVWTDLSTPPDAWRKMLLRVKPLWDLNPLMRVRETCIVYLTLSLFTSNTSVMSEVYQPCQTYVYSASSMDLLYTQVCDRRWEWPGNETKEHRASLCYGDQNT